MKSPLKFRTLLLRSSRLLSDEFNELLLPFQLNYSLWLVVYFIEERPEITSIDLAKLLNVSKPSIAKRVNTLMQLNIITYLKSDDKRLKKLILTEHGHTIYSACSSQIDEYEALFLNDIDPIQLQQASQLLMQVMLKLENKNGVQSGDQT